MKTALLMSGNGPESLSLARKLDRFGWKILASSGTAKSLRECDIEAVDVYDNIKNREAEAAKLAAAILGDAEMLSRLGVASIDLIAVDLKVSNEKVDGWPHLDFGGVTLVGAAIKAKKIVAVTSFDFSEVEHHVSMGSASENRPRRELSRRTTATLSSYYQNLYDRSI